MPLQPTERFSSRVEDYRQYRPHYPQAIVDLLARVCGLSRDMQIADIAAGTGLLTEIFLTHGNPVIAVEPNAAMREACATLLTHYPHLQCVDGTAEATDLPARSVDMVTVGQAMHWFDLVRTRAEFARILRPAGWCVVVYNHRHLEGDEFAVGYERILQEFGMDYQMVQGKHLHEEKLIDFFAPAQMRQTILPNMQQLSLDGLQGRILSSSYMPQAEHPRYSAMLQEIKALFTRCQQNGYVSVKYDCAVSYGQIG
ncbi:MAG TPA: class I SAM-dependent methyltransferase [Acidobacteriaceae bacterium]|jgi:SAM-dependent methyltransferase|nr:class I SAM-dependent methyltransferase [Acidobacteriaceae bacterium]